MNDVFPTLIPYTRCNKCQEHGHKTEKYPRKNTVCPHCSGNHNHYQCILKNNRTQKLCANCKGNHGAAFKKCPSFLQHKYIIDKKNNNINREWRNRKAKTYKDESPPSLLDLPPILPTWARKETPSYNPPKDPIKPTYIQINQLKHILTDLLETPREVLETIPKAEIVDNILCKHITQSKSPNLLTPPPQVSPVLITPSHNIPHFQPTSTPRNQTEIYRTPKRRVATPTWRTRTRPTVRNVLLINTSDPISVD